MAVVKFPHSKNFYSRFKINGKDFQKTTKTANRKLAEKIDQQWYEEELAKTYNVGTKSITVEEAFKGFAKTRPNDKNVRVGVQFLLKWLPEQNIVKLTDPISTITNSVLERIVETRRTEGKKEGTTNQTLGFVNRVLNWAKKNGYEVAPVDPPRIKVKNGRLRWLTKEEEARLLEELDPHRRDAVLPDDYRDKRFYQDNYDLAVLLLDTGARLTEITTLRWKSVDLKAGTISLFRSKVNNESILHMTDRVLAILGRRAKNKIGEFVFTDSVDGHKKSVGGVRAAIKRAGLHDCNLHTFRHTYCSRLAQQGIPLYEIANMVGHSNIAMTQRYAHLVQQDISKKVAIVINALNSNQSAGINLTSSSGSTLELLSQK